jgi:hypothetical protein
LKTSDDYLLASRDNADLFKLRYKMRKRPLDRLLGAVRLASSTLAARLAFGPARGVG